MVNWSYGKWLKWSVPYEAAPLYAPQGVEMGEVAPPHKIGLTQLIGQNQISAFHNAGHPIKYYTKSPIN